MSAGSVTGDEIYTNIYTIAAFVGSPDPQVYLKQLHPQSEGSLGGKYVRIPEWSNADSWDRGTIDVLFPVKLGGAAIDSGNLALFARQTGDTFTHTEATVSTAQGARTPIAAETSGDMVNITKGEHYLLYDGEVGGGFAVGNVIQNVATDSVTPPSWYAEVVEIADWGTTGCLTLRGLRGSIPDNASIYVGTTKRGDSNGTPGDTYVTYDATTTAPVAGDLNKAFEGSVSLAQRVLRGYQHDAPGGKLVLQVYHTHGVFDGQTYTGSGRDDLYRDLADNDVLDAPTGGAGLMVVTLDANSVTLISGYSDVSIAHVNGTVVCDTFSGSFVMGERVTWTGGGPAWIVKTNGSTEITLANIVSEVGLTTDNLVITGDISGATCQTNGVGGLTDAYKEGFAFPLQSEYDYAVFIECGSIYEAGRDLDDVYAFLQYKCRDGETDDFYTSSGSAIVLVNGQFYIKAYTAYSAIKIAPFGTLAGGVLFGAQGVWVQGMTSADVNNIKLTDDTGTLRQPYASVDVTISNTRVSDVIVVFFEAGTTTLPDKAQFSCVANAKSASTLQGSASHPNDTPSTGWVYVVDVSANEEHKYRYTSWTTDTLTLATEVAGTAEAGTSGQTLIDTGMFPATAVQRGDIIRRTTDNAWCYIVTRVSDNEVKTTVLSDGSDWAVGNTFEVNSLVADYTTSDKYFIPYLEAIETTGTDGSPGSEAKTLTYVTDRAVVISVRNVLAAVPIQPFDTTSDITIAGMTVSVIRTKDEVYG